MPVKKKTAEEKKPATKKAPAKAAEKKEAVATKATAKKETVAKKVAEEKPAAKKTTTKKATTAKKTTTTKKTTTKKTTTAKKTTKKAAEVAEVVKKTVKDYEDIINWKKGEAHAMDWLYIEVSAGELLTEVEAGVDNLTTVCNAILNCMLEGDGFITEPVEEDKVNEALRVRYYCDNLSQDRKKYFDR